MAMISVCRDVPMAPRLLQKEGPSPQTWRARAGRTAALSGYTDRLDVAGTFGEAGLVRGMPGFGAQSSPPHWVSHKARTTLPQSKAPRSCPSPAGRVRANPPARRFPVLCFSCVCEAPSSHVQAPRPAPAGGPHAGVWHACGPFATPGWALPAVLMSCAYVKARVNLVIIKCRNLGLAGFSFFVCTILQSAIFRNG